MHTNKLLSIFKGGLSLIISLIIDFVFIIILAFVLNIVYSLLYNSPLKFMFEYTITENLLYLLGCGIYLIVFAMSFSVNKNVILKINKDKPIRGYNMLITGKFVFIAYYIISILAAFFMRISDYAYYEQLEISGILAAMTYFIFQERNKYIENNKETNSWKKDALADFEKHYGKKYRQMIEERKSASKGDVTPDLQLIYEILYDKGGFKKSPSEQVKMLCDYYGEDHNKYKNINPYLAISEILSSCANVNGTFKEQLEQMKEYYGLNDASNDDSKYFNALYNDLLEEHFERKEKKMDKKIKVLIISIVILTWIICVLIGISIYKSKNDNAVINQSVSNEKTSDMVYIGKTGNKYHEANCTTLKGKGEAISMDEALEQGREACQMCH